MSRIRSPNYPVMSLPEAIARVTTVHDRERHLAAPKEVIAKHLGYGGINGASAKAISALVKYGLLEEVAGDKFKVSGAALSILHPRSPDEKAQAIRDAAVRPAVFADMAGEWPDGHPSDDNLRSWLVRRNFASDAIDRVIRIFRENVELVAREAGAYDSAPTVKEVSVDTNSAIDTGGRGMRAPLAGSKPPVQTGDVCDLELNSPQIIDHGSTLQVVGLVDRKGLERLIKKLSAYKAVLDAAYLDDEEDDGLGQ